MNRSLKQKALFLGCPIYAAINFGIHRLLDHEPVGNTLIKTLISTVIFGVIFYFVFTRMWKKRNRN